MPAPLLTIENLTMSYRNGREVLRDVSLSVAGGECVVVLGSNGSGKSTMLRCVVRLLTPLGGRILVAGRDLATLSGAELRAARRPVAMVFQQAHLVRRRSAVANVLAGSLGRRRDLRTALGFLPAEEMPAAYGHLATVGLTSVAEQRAGTLSGGQAQRVAIARALAQEPRVLLADEPVASLDPEAAEDVMRLLARLAHEQGLAVLCVLHQPGLALRHADRIIGLRNGSIAFDKPSSRIEAEAINALYVGEAA